MELLCWKAHIVESITTPADDLTEAVNADSIRLVNRGACLLLFYIDNENHYQIE